jgi:galactose mutarotase-like enzyme
MRSILIQNADRSIAAEVLPEFGGMVAKLRVDGRNVLFLDENRLAESPGLAGGIPVLFPFAGRTKNDSYEINAVPYHMPMHGVVKNRSFLIKEQSEDTVTVWTKQDEALLSENYPFLFILELSYRVIDTALELTAHIENRSGEPLPHTLGLHPYFKASNRNLLEFSHTMTVHYDYAKEMDAKAPSVIRLDQDLDDVYCMPLLSEFTLTNASDGYAVRCVMDKAFQAIVVYTGTPGSVCIEPWCGIPDSINNGRMIRWIPPGASSDYEVRLYIKSQ